MGLLTRDSYTSNKNTQKHPVNSLRILLQVVEKPPVVGYSEGIIGAYGEGGLY